MKIVVLVKEVPDMERVRFDTQRGVVNRSSAEAEINPFDLYALEAALQLKESVGAEVTALTMGPPRAATSLRDAYARGADKLTLLTDRKFGGSDTLATSRTIAASLKAMDFDLILCGEKSVDGDTAQVGAEVAELLDIPHSYFVDKLEPVQGGKIVVSVSDICGFGQKREMTLPALVSVDKGVSTPRLPTLKRKLASLSADIEKLGFNDLSAYLAEEETGLNGSPTKVSKIVIPEPARRESVLIRGNPTEFVAAFKAVFAAERMGRYD